MEKLGEHANMAERNRRDASTTQKLPLTAGRATPAFRVEPTKTKRGKFESEMCLNTKIKNTR
jgi:hypothetical protein